MYGIEIKFEGGSKYNLIGCNRSEFHSLVVNELVDDTFNGKVVEGFVTDIVNGFDTVDNKVITYYYIEGHLLDPQLGVKYENNDIWVIGCMHDCKVTDLKQVYNMLVANIDDNYVW